MSDVPEPIESADYWLFPLEGLTVTQIRLDYGFTLIIGGSLRQRSYSIRVESRFAYTNESGDTAICVPGEDVRSVFPACQLLHSSAKAAYAFKSGQLELVFSEGKRLAVNAGEGYEPWQLSSSSGIQIASLPSGGLNVWSEGAESFIVGEDPMPEHLRARGYRYVDGPDPDERPDADDD